MPYLQSKTSGSIKRKPLNQETAARKKVKTEHFSAHDLPWKSISTPMRAGHANDEGIIELEEVEGIEVVYETMESGRVARFQVSCNLSSKSILAITSVIYEVSAQEGANDADIEEDAQDEEAVSTKRDEIEQTEDMVTFDGPTSCVFSPTCVIDISYIALNLLPNWYKYSLHPQLLSVLCNKGYTSPTPIQSAALPVAAANRDIVGIAQTVCKTFLILSYLISALGLRQNISIRTANSSSPSVTTATTREGTASSPSLDTSSHARTCSSSISAS